MELRLDVTKSFWENVAVYHERAKKLKRKIAKLEELLANPPKDMEEDKEKKPVLIKKRKRDWYEKFRWAFTSRGFLLIGGRDAKTNEILVKKYLEESDLYFHADVVGAPSVIMKNGQNAGEDDVFEAAVFAASYSKAWANGLASADVFYAGPDQVSLAPPSGEYRPRGGVMIYGKREWVKNVPLRLFVSFDDERDRFFVAMSPPDRYVEIVPGRIPKAEAAKKILTLFGKGKEYLSDLTAILPPNSLELRRKSI